MTEYVAETIFIEDSDTPKSLSEKWSNANIRAILKTCSKGDKVAIDGVTYEWPFDELLGGGDE